MKLKYQVEWFNAQGRHCLSEYASIMEVGRIVAALVRDGIDLHAINIRVYLASRL